MDGISPDDLPSIKRFHTSKIETVDDLFSINTLGFRGEALSSVASISKCQFCQVMETEKVQSYLF